MHIKAWVPFPSHLLQVPDYFDVIAKPMDFGTMRKKASDGEYDSIDAFEVSRFPSSAS